MKSGFPHTGRLLLIIHIILSAFLSTKADDFTLKSNLLYDATLTPSLSFEYAFAPRWSADLSGQVNFWDMSRGRKWKQWAIQPEARYWLCQALDGHFFAAHLIGGQYNFGHIDIPVSFLGTDFRELKDHRHQGWMAGAGVAYGYSWALAKHWNIEAELGIGWIFTRYDVYECSGCGNKSRSNVNHNYFGPTKGAVNLEYVF